MQHGTIDKIFPKMRHEGSNFVRFSSFWLFGVTDNPGTRFRETIASTVDLPSGKAKSAVWNGLLPGGT